MAERTLGYLEPLPAAVHSLSSLHPDAVALAHTGVSYLTGYASEPALIDRLRALAGPRAFTTARAIIAALRHLGIRRLALGTPYPEAIAAAGRAYWETAGSTRSITARRSMPTLVSRAGRCPTSSGARPKRSPRARASSARSTRADGLISPFSAG